MVILLKTALMLVLLSFSRLNFAVEYVDISRKFTPEIFTVGSAIYANSYMRENDLFELNTIDFYSSYIASVRRFVVDPLYRESYSRKEMKCYLSGNAYEIKNVIECGRVVALEYVESHNVSYNSFGFERLEVAVRVKKYDGISYFYKDRKRVFIHGIEGDAVFSKGRCKLTMYISPIGDYDQREVQMRFDREAFLLDSDC